MYTHEHCTMNHAYRVADDDAFSVLGTRCTRCGQPVADHAPYWTEEWRLRQSAYMDSLLATAEAYRITLSMLAMHGPRRGSHPDRAYIRTEADRLEAEAVRIGARLNELRIAYGPAR